jgi:hypothetical protein
MKGKKTGGRSKGTENKLTKEAREMFIETLEGLSPNVQKAFLDVLNGVKDDEGKWIKKPNPDRFLDLFAKYAQYFVPKKTEAEIDQKVSGSFDFNEIIERLKGDQS